MQKTSSPPADRQARGSRPLGRGGLMMVALLAFTGGCTTLGGGGGDVTLLERSKEQPPAWTALTPGRIHDWAKGIRFVETRSRILDLSVGLKDVQLSALRASRDALVENARLMVEGAADKARVNLRGSAVEVDRRLHQVVGEVHEQHARVGDIYFEKFRDNAAASGQPQALFYTTWVLVQMPEDGMSELMTRLGTRLSESGAPELKSLGAALTAPGRPGAEPVGH